MNLFETLSTPWAIRPEKLIAIHDLVAHMRGDQRDLDVIAARLGPAEEPARNAYQVTSGGVAIIAIDGVLAKRMNVLLRIFGGTSSQLIRRDIKAAVADPTVKGILLAIDSPGGTVDGTQELAQTVHEGATQKPIAAWSDGLIGSAAYWIGSAAPHVFISGDVVQAGSIGVVATHVDTSKAEASRGIKVTEIVAGSYKRIASQHAPLSDEGQRALQEQVDYVYETFVGDVARYRGKSPARVLNAMAEGRAFMGRQAISAGLVDAIATQESLIEDLAAGRIGRRAVA